MLDKKKNVAYTILKILLCVYQILKKLCVFGGSDMSTYINIFGESEQHESEKKNKDFNFVDTHIVFYHRPIWK